MIRDKRILIERTLLQNSDSGTDLSLVASVSIDI